MGRWMVTDEIPDFKQVSHEEKKTALLSIESWLVKDGILIMVYYNPYITG